MNASAPKSCPVCGAGDVVEVRTYVNEEFPSSDLFSGLDLFCCRTCGFGFSWPEISDQAVQEFYGRAYRDPTSPLRIDFNRLKRPFRPDQRSMSQLLLARQYVDFKGGDCFLDIGPGPGASFDSAAATLPTPVCAAVELSEGAAQAYARVYQVTTYGSIDQFIAAGLKAKICLMSHSLEHFKPGWLAGALAELRSAIDESGILIIEVPLVDLRKHAAIPMGDAPHFCFFSIDSIEAVLKKNGWGVRFIDSCAVTYGQWIDQKRSNNSMVAPAARTLRKLVRGLFDRLPVHVQAFVRTLQREQGADAANPNFVYGGDRTCLRVVACQV